MICSKIPLRKHTNLSTKRAEMAYDYIIIGSGSAGAIIASRLSESSKNSVLLIESGPGYTSIDQTPNEVKYGFGANRNRSWFFTNPDHGRTFIGKSTELREPILVPRGKTLGGSSAVNAQIFLRGEPDDYDAWSKSGNDLWGFQECLPYFRKLENDIDFSGDFHGQSGPVRCIRTPKNEWQKDSVAFYDGFRDLGYAHVDDHNDPDSTGVGPLPFNTINRIRQNTWLTYLEPHLDRPNLTILSNAQVEKIILDNLQAKGVIVKTERGVETIQGNEIIVSAGAINSPQILMLSGIGPDDMLSKKGIKTLLDQPNLGKNLRDHPQVPLTWQVQKGQESDPDLRGVDVAIRYTANGSNLRNDMMIHHTSFGMGSKLYFGDTTNMFGRVGMIVAIYLAKGQGELSLRTSDPRIQPYINYNFFKETEDLRRMRDAVRMCVEIGAGSSYKDLIDFRLAPSEEILNSDTQLDIWIKENARTSHHISGTCKMGQESDPTSVVDQYGNVHGTKNLKVADASIMPDCPRANTNVPTMMIGEKISDLILNS